MKKRKGRKGARKKPHSLALRQKKLEKTLLSAMDSANRRGFTGNFGSKGSLFDDPKVKRAKQNYDEFCDSVK